VGSIYKKFVTKPLPPSAELFTRKVRGLDRRFARWTDSRGRVHTAPARTPEKGKNAGVVRLWIETSTYYAKYRDADGQVREVATQCHDEAAARYVLADLERRAELVKAGVMTSVESSVADHQAESLMRHAETYVGHLIAKSVSRRRIKDMQRHLHRVASDLGFRRLPDLDAVALERWLVAQQTDGMSAATRNEYRGTWVGFANWCVQQRRLQANPFAFVPVADRKIDRRRQRRAMTEHELRRLLIVATRRPLAEFGRGAIRKDERDRKRDRDTWNAEPLAFDTLAITLERARERLKDNPTLIARLERLGRERALIYKALVLTGLRKGELASLTVGQLVLDGPHPHAVLNAADEKNRQGSQIAVRSDLADDLRSWLVDKLAEAQNAARLRTTGVPPKLPAGAKVFRVPAGLIRILDRDLKAAGIAKVDDRGRTIDVHALRHSFGTLLSKGGVAPRTAQAAMRHASIDLTMNVYTDPRLLDVQGALDALPALPLDDAVSTARQFLPATGTNDLAPRQIAPGLVRTTDFRGQSGSTAATTAVAATESNPGEESPQVSPQSIESNRSQASTKDVEQWAMRDSNPRHPRCKRGALTN